MTVKWKKNTVQTKGYEIQYSLKKNMKSAKTILIRKNKKGSVKIRGLKSKKKYYVRIRTYQIHGETYKSKWSGVKGVKIK